MLTADIPVGVETIILSFNSFLRHYINLDLPIPPLSIIINLKDYSDFVLEWLIIKSKASFYSLLSELISEN